VAWVDGKIEMTGAAGGVQVAYAGTGEYSFIDIVGQAIQGGSNALAGAIYEEMEEIKAKSQEIVPLRFGILRASADAVGVNIQQVGLKGSVAIGYGGAAWAYSIIQHQTPPPDEAGEGELAFRHAAGRTWKYLERPVMEAIPGLDARLGAKVAARLAAG
jgi:hypothetical protein